MVSLPSIAVARWRCEARDRPARRRGCHGSVRAIRGHRSPADGCAHHHTARCPHRPRGTRTAPHRPVLLCPPEEQAGLRRREFGRDLLVQEGQQIRPQQRASAPSATIAASTRSEGARVVFFMSVLSSERRALPSASVVPRIFRFYQKDKPAHDNLRGQCSGFLWRFRQGAAGGISGPRQNVPPRSGKTEVLTVSAATIAPHHAGLAARSGSEAFGPAGQRQVSR
jgi:hypothetical protein